MAKLQNVDLQSINPQISRIDHLSKPPIRRLIITKCQYGHLFNEDRKNAVDKLIHESMSTMYSKADTNTKCPNVANQSVMLETDWIRYNDWLNYREKTRKNKHSSVRSGFSLYPAIETVENVIVKKKTDT